jgi:hypothetical protein
MLLSLGKALASRNTLRSLSILRMTMGNASKRKAAGLISTNPTTTIKASRQFQLKRKTESVF